MKIKYGGFRVTTLALLVISLSASSQADCPADLNGDNTVNIDDVFTTLGLWGVCPDPCPPYCNGDLTEDCTVDVDDIFEILGEWGPCDEIYGVELAGNVLAEYPYFEYVRAFNEGSDVHVALDPSRFPEITGETCDVFIVEGKTYDEWNSNAALVDVTGTGPQEVTFTAGNIQSNTFPISGSSSLSSEAGIGIGKPYDVVLDMNRNAILDGGDYIDGYDPSEGIIKIHGMYVVHDITQAGPLSVTTIDYSGGSWLGQRTYFPTNIGSMGAIPLVVISHGNGHDYTWYDYLGEHLASYGYIVMSHQNETGPGIETASTTTLTNTDYIIGNQSTIGGGVLNGHIDVGRLVWIGHSRGGEGVARAYDRLVDQSYTPTNFTSEDIVLVSSIAPTDFLGTGNSTPHDVNYHLIYGSADGDVGGYPTNPIAQSFIIYERAEGWRAATYVQGADHNDFNCCGFNDFEGPAGTEIGRPEAQQVSKSTYLALIKHFVDGNAPAKEFLWRQNENLKPIGVASSTIYDREFKDSPASGQFVIDDFQSQPATTISSSSGAVSYDVSNIHEGIMYESDGSFTWSASDPMNGMTRARSSDPSSGVVFDYSSDSYLEFEIISSERDFTDDVYLSFRACQGTRHPNTVSYLGDHDFAVTLRDGTDTASSIHIGAYLGGIEEPYQRTGNGSGAGWQNEFETIRIRLTDFLTNGSGVNLADIEAVRFEFGPSYGSDEGRIALDDIVVSNDVSAPIPGSLSIRLITGAGDLIPPGIPITMTALISAANEELVPDTTMFHYRFNGEPYTTVPMTPQGNDQFEAVLPAAFCSDIVEFYFSAEGTESGVIYLPLGAPDDVFSPAIGEMAVVFEETFDTDPGWSTEGLWAFGHPTGGGGQYGGPDPTNGYTGSNVYGYNLNGDYENYLPERHLTSTAIDCTNLTDVHLKFWRWLGVEQPAYDHAYIRISTNGSIWATVWENTSEIADEAWTEIDIDISAYADNQPMVYLRWTMGTTDSSWQYCGWNIDDLRLTSFVCEDPP